MELNTPDQWMTAGRRPSCQHSLSAAILPRKQVADPAVLAIPPARLQPKPIHQHKSKQESGYNYAGTCSTRRPGPTNLVYMVRSNTRSLEVVQVQDSMSTLAYRHDAINRSRSS